ncbi:MAG: hypothetical protein ACK4SY_03465 [Pyrobaculum sp.]
MSIRDLNAFIKELIEKEIEKAMADIREEVKNTTAIIDRKIEELRQYLKNLES